jgi:hypothetical protein
MKSWNFLYGREDLIPSEPTGFNLSGQRFLNKSHDSIVCIWVQIPGFQRLHLQGKTLTGMGVLPG